MGGSSSDSEENSLQIHLAFKRMKVDQTTMDSFTSNFGSGSSRIQDQGQVLDSLNDSNISKETDQGAQSLKHAVKHKKMSARMEPYPQDVIFSIEKITFHQEECTSQRCMCKSKSNKQDQRKKYNYANASLASESPKRLIREARLKLHHSEKDRKHVIRAARLKLEKHERKSDSGVLIGTEPKFSAGATNLSSRVNKHHIFGIHCKEQFKNFSSCANHPNPQEKDLTSVYPRTSTGTRNSNQPGHVDSNALLNRLTQEDLETANDEPVLDKTCSQEARLDDMTVTELASYFENFVYIPKKMSSMAEMMYI